MRLLAILMTCSLMEASASGISQNITLNVKNEPFEKVLKRIKAQSGYQIFYKDQDIKMGHPVTIQRQNISIREALDIVFSGQALIYIIQDNVIIIKPKTEKAVSNILSPPADSTITVTGRIVNEKGEPLSGATISIKGTGRAINSDANGNFLLKEMDSHAVLVVTYVGFKMREFPAGTNLGLIQLTPALSGLGEVVVVGYGSQKKEYLTGSVSTVSGEVLNQRPTPNVQNLLEGRVAGLTVVQPTGEPGLDAGSLQVRGLGSYGASSSPLILVDGIVSTLSNLSAQDIESVSVLKDATSSSIYGSRAANGVILITTRRGAKGRNQIQYINSFGTSKATVLPKFITNSATYMTMYNSASERSGQPDVYTQDQIDAYKNATDRTTYPNFNWLKYYFHNAPIQNHSVSLSGADSTSSYYFSVGYMHQKGIIDKYDYTRYNALLKYSKAINRVVSVGSNTNLSFEDIKSPIFTNDNAILLAYAQAPTFMPYLPDGSGRVAVRDYSDNSSPNRTLKERLDNGFRQTYNYNINEQGFISLKLMKELEWKTTGAAVFFNQDYKNRQYEQPYSVYAYHPDASGAYVEIDHSLTSSLYQYSERDLTLTVNSTLNFNHDFGRDHHFQAIGGYEQIYNKTTYIYGDRYNYTDNTINELSGGPSDGWDNGGDASEYALQSLFGRLNYNFQGKYLAEGVIRYDGTSRVDPKYRWGTFGGGSVAWLMSKEKFISKNLPWVSNLKLRGSYGVLGNQEIGNYPYQDVLSNTSYPFGSSLSSGATLTALTVKDLKWEKTATTDIGLNLDIFDGLFGTTIDWYRKNTSGILASESDLPASVGLSAPTVNSGAMQNQGIEIELHHGQKFGDFSYNVNFMISRNRNKVTQALAPSKGTFQVGLPYNSFYMYKWIGIFQSQDEIDQSPTQPNSGTLKPGDLKIKDVNNDGTVDADDRVSISPYPSYTYSFGGNFGWKQFSLSAFFQGVRGQKFNVTGWGLDPFIQGTAPTTEFLHAWTAENKSQTVPAVYMNGYTGVSGYSSTYYLRDASYLRLKNVNLSYAFQHKSMPPWIKELSIYISGDNIITWTKYKNSDPERASSGRFAQFPQLKIYNGGVKLTF